MSTKRLPRVMPTSVIVSVLLALAFTTRTEAQSSSSSYRLEPATLAASGGATSGATVREDGTLAQSATVGASASFHYIVQSGHWSFLGSTVVPVVLLTSKHPGIPGAVDLSWSGNNALYAIYRATDPASIFGGAALASTSNNTYGDSAPPSGGLVCYSVFAGPPGPLPPAAAQGSSP